MKRIRRTLLCTMMAALAAGVLASPASAFVNYSLSLSFGSVGEGNGQFKEPRAIDIDPAGNVWVADGHTYPNRIQKFDSKGKYLTTITTGKYPIEPTDIATDSKGNVWEVEWQGERVVEFSPEGSFIREFGELGSGNGQFWNPNHIAIDSKDNIWVSDVSNFRIEKFNSEGKYLAQAGSEGTGNGQFIYPVGIATDSAGNVWVSDTDSSTEIARIEKFDSSGKYLSTIAKGQIGGGSEDSLAIDSKDNIWIGNADYENEGLKVFSPAGSELAEFGKSGSVGPLDLPGGLAFDPSGNPWLFNYPWITGYPRIEKWTPLPPTATTEAATGVKQTEAILHATINPQGTSTTYQFEYGTTTGYGSKIPLSPGSAGSGITGVAVKPTLSGLTANTTYHYRIVATSAAGTTKGADKTFLTAPKNPELWYVGGVKLAEGTSTQLWMKGATNYVLRWKVGAESFASTCTFQKEVALIENPAGGFAGTASTTTFVLNNCTLTETPSKGCTMKSALAEASVKGVTTLFEGKPAVSFTPGTGGNLFSFKVSECENTLLNATYTFSGAFTGIVNNATSIIEFTKASSAMTSGGLAATMEGTSKIEDTSGHLVTVAL